MKVLWTKSKSEVEADEYTAFYKQTFHDWTDPLETIAFKAEGTFNYQALLFAYESTKYSFMQNTRSVLSST